MKYMFFTHIYIPLLQRSTTTAVKGTDIIEAEEAVTEEVRLVGVLQCSAV